MSELSTLAAAVIAFRDERDWKQFHNPKDVAVSLVLEASELLEIFQWKREAELKEAVASDKEKIANELADVLYYTLLLSHDLGIDLGQALRDKMKINEAKYPADKARGNNRKYTDL